MALVTIYLVNHNYAKYLEQSINSIMVYANDPRFELLLFDNGSSDGSDEIIKKYENQFSNVIFQPNVGLITTCNRALDLAKGEYLIRLDADDYFVENALTEVVKSILEKKPDLIYGNYYTVNREGDILKEIQRVGPRDNAVRHRPSHGACSAFRIEFLKKFGGYSRYYDRQDGYDIWLKAIRFGQISFIEKPLFFYRQHGVNLTSNWSAILRTRRLIKKTFFKEWIDVKYNTRILLDFRDYIPNSSLERLNMMSFIAELSLNENDRVLVSIMHDDKSILDYCHMMNIEVCNNTQKYDEDILVIFDRPLRIQSMSLIDEMIISTFIFQTQHCYLAEELNKDNLMRFSPNGLESYLHKKDEHQIIDHEHNDLFQIYDSLYVVNNLFRNNRATYVQNAD